MKSEIEVLIIENDTEAFSLFSQTLELGVNNNVPNSYIFIFPKDISAFNSLHTAEFIQKQKIINTLKSQKYEIVIFDIFLREKEEGLDVFEEGADSLLSIKIANEMKSYFIKNNILVLFTSGHRKLLHRYQYNQFRDNNSPLIDEKWNFIFKPFYNEEDFPEMWELCPGLCNDLSRFKTTGCKNQSLCFLYNLSDLFDSFKQDGKK